MRALTALPLLGAVVSVGCGFAALGVALYPQAQVWSAGSLYGAFGLAAGAVCGVIDLAWRRLPSAGAGAGRAEAGSSSWADSATAARGAPSNGHSARAVQPSSFGA